MSSTTLPEFVIAADVYTTVKLDTVPDLTALAQAFGLVENKKELEKNAWVKASLKNVRGTITVSVFEDKKGRISLSIKGLAVKA